MVAMSLAQTPAATTRTSASPAPGTGSPWSTQRKRGGPPTPTACMASSACVTASGRRSAGVGETRAPAHRCQRWPASICMADDAREGQIEPLQLVEASAVLGDRAGAVDDEDQLQGDVVCRRIRPELALVLGELDGG